MPVHTYLSYAFDGASRRLVYAGSSRDYHLYDPATADWVGSGPRHAGMLPNSVFTQVLVETANGVLCWTQEGRLFRLDSGGEGWQELRVIGHIPGSVVDHSGIAYDSNRDRILLVRRAYGGPPFDGQVYAVALKTMQAETLSPAGMERAARFPFISRLVYDPDSDLMFVGTALPAGPDGVRRTSAYDGARNRWVTVKIDGDIPPGGHSFGVVYDKRRKLQWAANHLGQVWVLRFARDAADMRPL
jgi:hypothetical protein